jgi:hypothetical protein
MAPTQVTETLHRVDLAEITSPEDEFFDQVD